MYEYFQNTEEFASNFEDLGKFKFTLKTNLGYESRHQVGTFCEKTGDEKSHEVVPLSSCIDILIL
jgi:hypothetical protein